MSVSGPQQGVVMSGTGGVWRVYLREDRRTVDASLRGRLKRTREEGEEAPVKLAVGDEVRVEAGTHDDWAIVEILPRRSKLARRAPSGAHEIGRAHV